MNASSPRRWSLRVTDSPRPAESARRWGGSSYVRRLRLSGPGVAGFAEGLAFEFQPIGVMHQAIQNGIGHGGVGDDRMPLADGELAGDEGGPLALPIIEDFQQIAVLLAGDAGHAEVINDQQRNPGQLLKQWQEAAIGLRGLQGAKEFGAWCERPVASGRLAGPGRRREGFTRTVGPVIRSCDVLSTTAWPAIVRSAPLRPRGWR